MNPLLANYSSDFAELLKRYAELTVRHGLNVQPGQLVQVSAEIAHRPLVSLIVEEAYRQGAGYVNVELIDPLVVRSRVLESRSEYLATTPAFFSSKFTELVEVGAANLKILGPEYPDYLSDLEPNAVNEVRKASYRAAKHFYKEGIEKSKVHWCVIAAATPAWGERIFRGEKGSVAEMKLWDQIFKICRVDHPDFLARWADHNRTLWRRASMLTQLNISQLHFTGPGTDLKVGLSPRAIFKGGSDRSTDGKEFEPNLPTEECFTTPDCRLTHGTVAATRPFYVNGCLIKDLSMTFEKGQLSGFSCTEGAATLEAYLSSDDGAKRLGEVALVGIDSPVFQSGLVFQEILYDENAACHIALGSAYRGCLQNGASLSEEECVEVGCNTSTVHTDIMISNEAVDVRAVLQSGEIVELLSKGRWSGEFAI